MQNFKKRKQEGHATRHTAQKTTCRIHTQGIGWKWSDKLNEVLVVVIDEAECDGGDEDMP